MSISRTSHGLLLSVWLWVELCMAGPARAQAIAESELEELGGVTASATTNDSGPAGIIPAVRGFDASLTTSSQHDSSNGWSSVLEPNLAYRLNKYFSADVETPWYMYINIDANVGHKGQAGVRLFAEEERLRGYGPCCPFRCDCADS